MIDNMVEKLELFIQIANLGSLTQAAEAMHISQSTVSGHLKNLETQMGAPLFERVGRGIQLNSNGKFFLEFAKATLQEFDKMQKNIQGNAANQLQHLTICAGNYFNDYYLSMILPLFAPTHPHVKTEIVSRHPGEAIAAIVQNQYDLGIMATSHPLHSSRIQVDFSYEIPLNFICSPDNALSKRGAVSAGQIRDQVFIFTGKETGYRTYLEREFSKHRYRFSSDSTIDSLDAIKAAVISNLGVSIIPRHIAQRELDENKLVSLPVKDLKLTRSLVGIHNVERQLSKVAREFIDVTIDFLNLQGTISTGENGA